ncbi:MAG: deoxyhypusine synthase family protein [Pyrinomonadaceae bacterium]
MAVKKVSKASKFLTVPTRPVPIDRDRSVAGLLEKMEGAGFGARQMAEAHRIWIDMLDDNVTVFLCGTGNLIQSGMRRLLAHIIKNRFVDVLVLSGNIIFQDIHETLGRNHYQAHPSMDDDELEKAEITRLGDTLANQEEYKEADEWIGSVINQLEQSRSYSTREFLHLVGRELTEIAHEDGVLTSAFKSRVPIYCPDLLSSQLSVGISRCKFEKKIDFNLDVSQDSLEMMVITQRTRNSGIITLGSVGSQDMLNTAEIASYITRSKPRGHKYAVSVSTEAMPLGVRTPSINGNHVDIFGKLMKNAVTAYVPCDPSIALPMLVTALSQTAAKFIKSRKHPQFTLANKDLGVDIP